VNLPAALVATVIFFMLIVALLYSYAKRSSPQRAAEIRQRMLESRSASAAGPDGPVPGGHGPTPGGRRPMP